MLDSLGKALYRALMTRQALAALVSAVLASGIARGGAPTLASDLSVTMHDAAITYVPGHAVIYTIVVANAGPDAATGATVTDPVTSLAPVSSAAWTCTGAGGATCTPGPVTGDIDDVVDLPVGGSVTYTLTVLAKAGVTADLVNTVTVAPPAGTSDPGPGPNTATDTNPAATLFYAATTGIDSETCGASAAPCKTIQKAIDNAAAGDAVIVRAGDYNECIVLIPGTGVGGIFVESEEFATAGTAVGTAIDGTDVCDAESDAPGPVVKMSDRSTLRGFTIEHGGDSGVQALGAVTIESNLIDTNTTSSVGGGIYLGTGLNLSDPNAKAIIKSNTIADNTSAADGAGIYVDASATNNVPSVVEITTNVVRGNTAGDGTAAALGGGITAVTDTATPADRSVVTITGNLIDGNVAKNATLGGALAYGGGIFVTTGGTSGAGTETVTIGDTGGGNVVRNNLSEGIGGGISVSVRPGTGGTHAAVVAANTVTANSGKAGAGGLALVLQASDQPAAAAPTASLVASANSLIGNHAQGDLSSPVSFGGGGLFAELDSARTPASAVRFEIDGNTIESNDATTHGGGARLVASADDDPASDGATAPANATISFHNNLVAQNLARDASAGGASGGGVHALAAARGASAVAAIALTFNTIVENETEIGTGGIELQDALLPDSLGSPGTASFTLADSIVANNEGFGVGFTTPLDAGTSLSVAYSDAFGNVSGNFQAPLTDPTGTNGNISVDPALDALFLSLICGPTVDLGDPAIDPGNEPLPNGGRVNMGHLGNTAGATRTIPDINGDGTVDGLDVLAIAASFASLTGDPRFIPAADRDLNGAIDGNDLAFVSAFYAQSCP